MPVIPKFKTILPFCRYLYRLMHNLISTVAYFVLAPSLWILVLFALAFFAKRSTVKKVFNLFGLLLFLLFSNPWLLNWYARQYQPSPVRLAADITYSCGIVPGGFASPDKDGNAVFNSTADRFIQVLKLYRQGHISHILVSGGNGKKEMKAFREGAWVKNQFIIMGVPDSLIFVEDQSNNTLENARNSGKILKERFLQPPYLLISSAHHLPRATQIFKNAGVKTQPYPCSYIAGQGIATWASIIPSYGTLQTWNIFLKETAGYYWYRQ